MYGDNINSARSAYIWRDVVQRAKVMWKKKYSAVMKAIMRQRREMMASSTLGVNMMFENDKRGDNGVAR